MIPKWNCENFPIFTWNLTLFVVLFVTIKGVSMSSKNLAAEKNIISQQQPLLGDEVRNNLTTTPNILKTVTTTTTTTTASPPPSNEKILSRRRRYLVFPAGSSIQVGVYFIIKLNFI